MEKITQILVPVDFSAASKIALDQAAAIARLTHAAVDILHVWDLPALVSDESVSELQGLPSSAAEAVSRYAKDTLAAFTKKAQDSGITVRNARAVPGNGYRNIVEEAARGGYDLIVIGTHGRKHLSRVFLGSVAEQVVRHANCPVLVARARGEESPADRVA